MTLVMTSEVSGHRMALGDWRLVLEAGQAVFAEAMLQLGEQHAGHPAALSGL